MNIGKVEIDLSGERVAIVSLGCSRNTVDSEKILADAKSQGARITPLNKATAVLVNTCAFTQDAKEESIAAILDLIELKKKAKIDKIFVYGCLSERYGGELKENFNEIDGFSGVAGFKRTFDSEIRISPPHYAYIKICEGCANLCSFCAIPKIKGPLKSRGKSFILKEARALEASGVKELIIIGQDITMYGYDLPENNTAKSGRRNSSSALLKLLQKILKETSIPWIRLLYLHPMRIGEDLIELIASEKRVCSYIDMPLQHISDRILRLMNRRMQKKQIIGLIKKIRRCIPDVALRTTFIAGFPSETKKEFMELLDFVKLMRFDRMGAFIFSREEGTRAYRFKGQLNKREKMRRYNALMSLQKKVTQDIQKEEVGKILEVMVDERKRGEEGFYLGRTFKDAPEVDGLLFLKSKSRLRPGSIVGARITDSYFYDLIGEFNQ